MKFVESKFGSGETLRASLTAAWDDLLAHMDSGAPLTPSANRLAFADPEFMMRSNARGVRGQLVLL